MSVISVEWYTVKVVTDSRGCSVGTNNEVSGRYLSFGFLGVFNECTGFLDVGP